ncbi:hypothetical protein IQ07DRAFT_36168 [Pyrenochaeta sp. DS3sAY3a]|nr:hypothetical protein IQ07DRAFT_36168 [Pyrenochaeta sp. DS3sAY3a]
MAQTIAIVASPKSFHWRLLYYGPNCLELEELAYCMKLPRSNSYRSATSASALAILLCIIVSDRITLRYRGSVEFREDGQLFASARCCCIQGCKKSEFPMWYLWRRSGEQSPGRTLCDRQFL